MGDMLELGGFASFYHRQAGRRVSEVCDYLITVGRYCRLAVDEAKGFGLDKSRIFSCLHADQAREVLFKQVCPREGDVVLVKGSRSLKMERVLDP